MKRVGFYMGDRNEVTERELAAQNVEAIYYGGKRALAQAVKATDRKGHIVVPSISHLGNLIQDIHGHISDIASHKKYIFAIGENLDTRKIEIINIIGVIGQVEKILRERQAEKNKMMLKYGIIQRARKLHPTKCLTMRRAGISAKRIKELTGVSERQQTRLVQEGLKIAEIKQTLKK